MSQAGIRTPAKRKSADVGARFLATGQLTREHVANTATACEGGCPLVRDAESLMDATMGHPAVTLGAVRTTGNILIITGGLLPILAAIHSVCSSQPAAHELLTAVCLCCWWLPIATGVTLIRSAEAMSREA
jgi:hypothetical protein